MSYGPLSVQNFQRACIAICTALYRQPTVRLLSFLPLFFRGSATFPTATGKYCPTSFLVPTYFPGFCKFFNYRHRISGFLQFHDSRCQNAKFGLMYAKPLFPLTPFRISRYHSYRNCTPRITTAFYWSEVVVSSL